MKYKIKLPDSVFSEAWDALEGIRFEIERGIYKESDFEAMKELIKSMEARGTDRYLRHLTDDALKCLKEHLSNCAERCAEWNPQLARRLEKFAV